MVNKIFVLITVLLSFASCELDSFLFNPEKLDSYKLLGNIIPDSLLELVSLNSNGNTIYGYWVSSSGEHPGMTILYCHGNKHNIDEYWDRVMILHQLGLNIFIFDYRGFGMSEGESSEKGLFEDAEAALNYTLSRPETSVDSLCIYGYSLGSVSSIHLAANVINPLCLISEAPFASANSLTQGSLVLDIQSPMANRW